MIGQKILKIRKRKELTREGFSKLIKFSVSYIKDIESGKVNPSERFLVAVSKEFNISIDALLSKNIILKEIDLWRDSPTSQLLFLYAFTQQGIDRIEDHLHELLSDRKCIFADVSNAKNYKEFYGEILKKKWTGFKMEEKLREMLVNDEIILIIKNFSLAKISKTYNKGYMIKDIAKETWSAHLKKQEEKYATAASRSIVILLDFPSFLEKHIHELADYTIPIYPSFLLDMFENVF